MEIRFKSPTQPQSLLNLDDILSQRPWETSSALLCAIRDATFATYLEEEHRSLLLGSIKALQVQESLFRRALGTFTVEWVPTRGEEQIIQTAYYGYYPVDVIEGAFYKYGGLHGIVALAIVFRDTYSILKQWAAIEVEAAQQWLVSNVSQLFSSQGNDWISNFIPQEPHNPYPLQHLGHHANRRKAVVLQATPLFCQPPPRGEDVPCPYFPRKYRQPQERHDGERASCQQPPTSTSIPSPDELDNERPKRSFQFQQGLPSPRSIASPPAQDHLQHQQLQEKHHNGRASSPITTPTSNASPSGLDLNLSCHDTVDPGTKGRIFEKQQHRCSPTPTSIELSLSCNDPPSSTSPDSSLIIAVYQKLDYHFKDLAMIMIFLGEANIPKGMLYRAVEPRRFFNRRGEPDSAPAPFLGHVFTNTRQLESALKHLESHALIQYVQPSDTFAVHSSLRLHVERSLPNYLVQKMKYNASRLVFHTFPTDSDLIVGRELYVELCRSQLPQLQHVLTYFTPDFLQQFSPPERLQVVVSCLSSSKFERLDWKQRMLRTAEEIMEDCYDPLLLAKLNLRKRKLSRLFPGNIKDCEAALGLHPVDESSNSHLGDVMLFDAQILMDRNELSGAWSILDGFCALNRTKPSTEERRVLQHITLFRVRICRYSGDYGGSMRLLMELYCTSGLSKSVLPGMISQLTSVHCELGETDATMRLIQPHDFVSLAWLEIQGQARLLSLASAEAHFMVGLRMLMENEKAFDAAQSSLRTAKEIYRKLEGMYSEIPSPSIVSLFRHFSVSAGLAMIAHLEGRFGSAKLGDARSYWKSASDVAERMCGICGWKPGSVQMVIAYSVSDITWRLGMPMTTANLIKEASKLYAQTGRQSYFFALALWFDLIEDGLESNGLGRITSSGMMERQSENGFP